MLKQIIYLVALILMFSHKCFSQDSIQKKLKEIIISDTKKIPTQPSSQIIDSSIKQQFQTNTLQSLLQLHSNVFVKNYGVSGLSTISIRGSSAAQTQILWNGINLNNTMTGITDFSAIPVGLFDKIKIDYSNNSMASLSGNVSLDAQKPNFKNEKSLNISIGYESIHTKNLLLGYNWGNKKLQTNTKIYVSSGRNNFPFYNYEQQKEQKLLHAVSCQIGFMEDLHFRINSKNNLSFHFWGQHITREIPPTLFEILSVKKEKNSSFRNIVNWKYLINSKSEINSSIAMMLEQYEYQDSTINLKSQANSINIPLNIMFKKKINKNQNFQISLHGSNSKIINQTASDFNRASLLLNYSIEKIANRIFISTLIQKEITNIFQVPLTGKLSSQIELVKHLQFNVSISKNYRVPTLNELFYQPGGNINLKPEVGKNVETGLQLNINKPSFQFYNEISFFNRIVDNWIAWFGNSILTPHNIQQVHSRGFEVISNGIFHLENKSDSVNKLLKTSFLYAYTLSTTQKSALINDYSIGKQIPYVPRYQIKGSIGFQIKKFECSLIQTYTGYRFVTTDESQFLLPYSSSNIHGTYSFKVKSIDLNLNVKINNLLNKSYESIVGRMMPGRNFSIGTQINL